jgi:hypothetical protein
LASLSFKVAFLNVRARFALPSQSAADAARAQPALVNCAVDRQLRHAKDVCGLADLVMRGYAFDCFPYSIGGRKNRSTKPCPETCPEMRKSTVLKRTYQHLRAPTMRDKRQLVRTHNPLVLGSNPSGPKSSRTATPIGFAVRVGCVRVAGSQPPRLEHDAANPGTSPRRRARHLDAELVAFRDGFPHFPLVMARILPSSVETIARKPSIHLERVIGDWQRRLRASEHRCGQHRPWEATPERSEPAAPSASRHCACWLLLIDMLRRKEDTRTAPRLRAAAAEAPRSPLRLPYGLKCWQESTRALRSCER